MPEDKAAKKRASDDLNDIEALRKIPAYNRVFGRRVWDEVDKRREKVLHGKLTDDQLHDARIEYQSWKDMAEMLTGDEAACRRIIDSETQAD
jgi:hypothetical protein